MTPKIHLTAFEDRPGRFIFVAVPDERGRYVRTDRSVALVACRHCGVTVGEPCRSKHGYHAGTHVARLIDYNRLGFPIRIQADDVILPPFVTPDEWMEAAA